MKFKKKLEQQQQHTRASKLSKCRSAQWKASRSIKDSPRMASRMYYQCIPGHCMSPHDNETNDSNTKTTKTTTTTRERKKKKT